MERYATEMELIMKKLLALVGLFAVVTCWSAVPSYESVKTNILNAPYFIFQGCSLTSDGSLPAINPAHISVITGDGNDWPSQLMSLIGVRAHGAYINWARGDDTLTNIVNYRYFTNEHTTLNLSAGPGIYLGEFGVINSLGAGYSSNSIIIDLQNLFTLAHNDHLLVAPMNFPWVQNFSAGQSNNWECVNGWLAANSNLYDFPLVNARALATNPAVQYASGGADVVHWGAPLNGQVAAAYASVLSNWCPLPRIFEVGGRLKHDQVNTNIVAQNEVKANLLHVYQFPGPSPTLGTLQNDTGRDRGGYLWFGTNVSYGDVDLEIYSYDKNNNSYHPIRATASAYQLDLGPIGFQSYLTNTPTGVGIYFGTTSGPTFGAGNGSLYLSSISNGVMYFRTNGAWVIK